MENMISVKEGTKFCIDARELYEKLSVNRRFDHWITHRIQRYQLIQNEDYTYFKTTTVRYYLTLSAAKHLCMVEDTDKGRLVRQWFIDRENKLREIEQAKPNVSLSIVESITLILKSGQEMLRVAQAQEQMKLELESTRKLAIQANAYNSGRTDFYTIRGYSKVIGKKLSSTEAKEIAYIARRLSKENNIEVQKCNDERYGTVNLYHESMLQCAFEEWEDSSNDLRLL
jgi:anti-repressor protein